MRVRLAEAIDRPFLMQMACLASTIQDRPVPAADDPDVLGLLPERSDAAVVAIDDQGQPLGAAWWFFSPAPLVRSAAGEALPEMVIAAVERARRQGIGAQLIEALAVEAVRRSFAALTLNVDIRNPAARLYTRTGFTVAGAGSGVFGVAMIRRLRVEGAAESDAFKLDFEPDPRGQAGMESGPTLVKVSPAMAAERAAMLERLEAGLRGDARVVAAWLGGSIGRGEADDLSDIDVHLAVADERCAELNAQRRAFVAGFGEPVLVQEAPHNAPAGGTFLLVFYQGTVAPVEVDWSWRPASLAAIPQRAVVLFDRSPGLPLAPSTVTLTSEAVARQISLSTTFFWAMAFIAAKKIARREPDAAFGLLRMMHQARDGVRDRLAGVLQPSWGAIAAPRETLPPTDPRQQIVDLSELLADMQRLQPTTDAEGGLVSYAAVSAVRDFVQLVARDVLRPRSR